MLTVIPPIVSRGLYFLLQMLLYQMFMELAAPLENYFCCCCCVFYGLVFGFFFGGGWYFSFLGLGNLFGWLVGWLVLGFLPGTFLLGIKIITETSWQRIHFYNFRIFIGKYEGLRISGVLLFLLLLLVKEKHPTNFI